MRRHRFGSSMNRRGQGGAVLVDVLTSMTIVLLLIGTAQTWARALLFAHKTLEITATAHEEACLAADAFAREIRNAGFDAGGGIAPVVAATADSIELVADLNGGGDVEDANERVRYAYRADRRQITRASGRGSPQPFADDVPPGGMSLSFWDGNGNQIASTGGEVDSAGLALIRRVEIHLQIELPNPQDARPIRADAFTTAALRNR